MVLCLREKRPDTDREENSLLAFKGEMSMSRQFYYVVWAYRHS